MQCRDITLLPMLRLNLLIQVRGIVVTLALI